MCRTRRTGNTRRHGKHQCDAAGRDGCDLERRRRGARRRRRSARGRRATAEARRRAAATPEAAWRLQQVHADDLASAYKELETLVHDADRKRRGSTPADAPTARRDDEAETDAPATTPDARPADAPSPAAEAKHDDDDDSWAEFY